MSDERAQICVRGHVVNKYAISYPDSNRPFCSECGSRTIDKCEYCDNLIEGRYSGMGGIYYNKPNYCNHCGKSFPWISETLNKVEKLGELAELSPEDVKELRDQIEEMFQNPGDPIAESKIKGILKKGGKELANGIRSVIIDLVSETVKKAVFGF